MAIVNPMGDAYETLLTTRTGVIHHAPTRVLSGPLSFVATELGWMVTELGRQPWVIYGILRTQIDTGAYL